MNHYLNAWNSYADFKGRSGRSEFWYFYIFNSFFVIVFSLLDSLIETKVFAITFVAAIIVPSLSAFVRRMHDIERSGYYLLLPIYNFYLAGKKGKRGTNKYGSDPRWYRTSIFY